MLAQEEANTPGIPCIFSGEVMEYIPLDLWKSSIICSGEASKFRTYGPKSPCTGSSKRYWSWPGTLGEVHPNKPVLNAWTTKRGHPAPEPGNHHRLVCELGQGCASALKRWRREGPGLARWSQRHLGMPMINVTAVIPKPWVDQPFRWLMFDGSG